LYFGSEKTSIFDDTRFCENIGSTKDSLDLSKKAVSSLHSLDSRNLSDKYFVFHCRFTSNQQYSQSKFSKNIGDDHDKTFENPIQELSISTNDNSNHAFAK
jgi:hypothetical protein